MLSVESLKVDRLGHSPFGHSGYAFLYAYYPLHDDVCDVSEFCNSRLVAVDEVFPSAIVCVGNRLPHLHEVTVSSGQGICSVHELWHLLLVEMEHSLQHSRYLFLACRAVACDGHLDFHWSILVYGHGVMYGGGNGYALCPSEFQHGLYVLAEEGSLDGHLVGQVLVYDTCHSLEYPTQSDVWVAELSQVNDSHSYHLSLVARSLDDTIAHDVGSWVDAQYYSLLVVHAPLLVYLDFIFVDFQVWSFFLSVEIGIVCQLVTDGALWTMSREDACLVWHLAYSSEALYEHEP